MSLTGIGATPEPQHTNGISGEQIKQQKLEENISLFAKFNDSDNKVDHSDVYYIAHNNVLRQSEEINSFLIQHKGKEWTDSLKNQINNLITRFNLECEGDAELEDMETSFERFRQDAHNDFESFKSDENQTIIDFNDEIKKENDDFKKECINKILNNLKDGHDGYLNLDGLGTIRYDKEQGSYVFERQNNNQTVILDDNKLNKIIELAIEHKKNITGKSYNEHSYSEIQG